MKILLKIFDLLINIIYLPFKLLKVKNKVTFISRLSNNIPLDYKLIVDELSQKKDLNIVILCSKLYKIRISTIFKAAFFSIKSVYHIATSKVVVIDTYNMAVSMLRHKKSLKVMMTWHSLAAVKKFGYQTIGMESGWSPTLATGLKMHKNYDAILSGSEEMTKYFSLAFNYPESYFLNIWLPRIDYLFENKDVIKKRIKKEYPNLLKKKVILYAPTYRTGENDNTQNLIDTTDFSKYNLVIKAHMRQDLDFNKDSVYTCKKFKAIELLTVADYLITDYSAISIEACVLDVKTFYYLYDLEEYERTTGLNIDLYKEMPGYTFKEINELYQKMNESKKNESMNEHDE